LKSNAINFSKIVFALLSKLFFEDWPFFVEQQGPHFLITVKCWGENTALFGVFPLFRFCWDKIFFTVACPVDCKLVRYCNIEVFLLVSQFSLCSGCSNLSEGMVHGCQFFFGMDLIERYGAIVNRKKNVR
jgi:hypothetical protein